MEPSLTLLNPFVMADGLCPKINIRRFQCFSNFPQLQQLIQPQFPRLPQLSHHCCLNRSSISLSRNLEQLNYKTVAIKDYARPPGATRLGAHPSSPIPVYLCHHLHGHLCSQIPSDLVARHLENFKPDSSNTVSDPSPSA